MTAAAAQLPEPGVALKKSGGGRDKSWQDRAWAHLEDGPEAVGELAYYVGWKTAAIGRCRLIASEIDPDTGKPTGAVEDLSIQKIVDDIGGGRAGQSQLLKRLGGFVTVPGYGYLALVERNQDATDDNPDDAIRPITTSSVPTEEWLALSRDEIEVKGSGKAAKVVLTLGDGTKHEFNKERDILVKIWEPDLRRHSEPTSQIKTALPILQEIVRATAQIDTAARSRLLGNGILLLPSQLSLPTPPKTGQTPDGTTVFHGPNEASAGDLQDLLFEVATTAIDDPSSQAANTPIIVTADGEWIKNAQHLKFDSDVSETALKTRQDAIRRLAMSLDISPERLLGLGNNSNHWTAWQINDDDVRVHIAPVLETICEAITANILRPALEVIGKDPSKYVVWFDASVLTKDPDQREEANEAYDRGVITAEAYLKYMGLDLDDGYQDTDESWRAWAAAAVRKDPALIDSLGAFLGFVSTPGQDDGDTPAALDPVMVKNMADAVGSLFRAGFDPIQSAKTVGLPEIAHTGLLPVTLTKPEAIAAEAEIAVDEADQATDGNDTPPEIEASAMTVDVIPAATFAIVKTYVDRALELAGKRLRTRADFAAVKDAPPHLAYLELGRAENITAARKAIDGWESIVDEVVVMSLNLDVDKVRTLVSSVASHALVMHRPPALTAEMLREVEL
ncbi:portal protein [Rhodococcus phage ReqiPine5]|uniref:Gp11 n=1 Tax=Rhodococcus phage ReqiPine5 TaxID=691963 RepID=D4P7Y6_9CAUD|nr:portal protein [Rhodococcus phage ReqiPine5]ADD81116.1 gp11 [Rhodococcus phage ReqiPine5]